MIDIDRPIRLAMDGKTRFSQKVVTSLLTALKPPARRHAWGPIYPIKITVNFAETIESTTETEESTIELLNSWQCQNVDDITCGFFGC